jgi:hypothetical protein
MQLFNIIFSATAAAGACSPHPPSDLLLTVLFVISFSLDFFINYGVYILTIVFILAFVLVTRFIITQYRAYRRFFLEKP